MSAQPREQLIIPISPTDELKLEQRLLNHLTPLPEDQFPGGSLLASLLSWDPDYQLPSGLSKKLRTFLVKNGVVDPTDHLVIALAISSALTQRMARRGGLSYANREGMPVTLGDIRRLTKEQPEATYPVRKDIGLVILQKLCSPPSIHTKHNLFSR